MKYKVYQYIFPNGKIYIGVTKNSIAKRREQGYQHNRELRNAYRECGWSNVKTLILAECGTQEEAFEKERFYIKKLKSTDSTIGFNISKGGKSTFQGLNHTEDHKKYMSELYKGREFSPDTIKKLKDAHAKERKAVYSISSSGERKLYKSLGEAAEQIGGYKTNITRAINRNKPYKGFVWQLVKRG